MTEMSGGGGATGIRGQDWGQARRNPEEFAGRGVRAGKRECEEEQGV